MSLKEFTQDGGAKSGFNQHPAMLEMLDDVKKARTGLHSKHNRVSRAYRNNYDNINWENQDGG